MYCKNCGANLNSNDKFCDNCGKSINSKDIQNNKSTVYQEKNNQNAQNSFNENFIKSYIGCKADKMYESVKNGGINIWAILFGTCYFIYRKMYLISILIVIVIDIINYMIPSIGKYVAMFIGLIFCPLYKWDITRKLRKIKKENSTANEEQLLEIAKNKGGTSIVSVIIFIVIYLLVLFI